MKNTIIVAVIILVIIGGAYFLLGKSGSSTPTPISTPTYPQTSETSATIPTPTTHNVSIQNFAFNQKSITIKKGDTVIWTNKDSVSHTVTGDTGGPASGSLNNNGTYSFTFNNTGIFNYHCTPHPSMTGIVVVD